MIMTWQFILFVILLKSLLGAGVGLAVTAILYHSRLTPGNFLMGVVLGVFGFLTGASLSGWGGAHAYFVNGKRMDQTPWGENLWLRNRLADNETVMSILLASLAVFLGYVVVRQMSVARRTP
ncbi:MAG: hypothetical protein WBQ04_14770 [Candidatus Acidiferrales bacterium]